MQREGASYMFLFATAVCVVCAVGVASSVVALRDRQNENAALDKQRNVLYSTGLASPEQQLGRDAILSLFEEKMKPIAVDIKTGEIASDVDAASYDMTKEAAGAEGWEAPENDAGIKRLSKYAIVYEVAGDDGRPSMYVLPIQGYGLWSTLYGFLAIDRDTTTVRGITYYKHAETPGLGGEVDNPRWKALWVGRKAYDENWKPALSVIKGQAGPPSSDPHNVDGLSGATLTSRGVSNMIGFWLGDKGFGPFLEKMRAQS